MITFAAVVPHTPLLIPSVGKEHREKLAATVAACQQIEQALYLAQPDTICIIAPHGTRYPDAFSANLAAKYVGTLKSFGDFATTIEAKSDALLMDRLQRKLRNENVPFTLTSNEELEYGYSVPLLLLTSRLAKRKIVPLAPSDLDGPAHYAFGQQLKRVLHAEDERVAFIASADFSHALNASSPKGAKPEGPMFDAAAKTALETHKAAPLLGLSTDVIANATQCAYKPLLTMLGLIEEMNLDSHVLSYEAPFGVGYMTAMYTVV